VQLIVYAGVLGVILAAVGLWAMLRSAELRQYRFLAITFVVLFIVFVGAAGRPYYLAGLYAPLAAAGALVLQRRREVAPTRRWPGRAAAAASVAVAAGALVLSVTLTRSEAGEHIARRAGDTYHALPAHQRDRTALIGESYIVAAYLDGYANRYRLPEAHSLNRSYGYFPSPADRADTALYIGRDPTALRRYFTSIRQIAEIGDDMRAYLLTGRRQSWDDIWRRERTLTVS
jgi:hypothetical protein